MAVALLWVDVNACLELKGHDGESQSVRLVLQLGEDHKIGKFDVVGFPTIADTADRGRRSDRLDETAVA